MANGLAVGEVFVRCAAGCLLFAVGSFLFAVAFLQVAVAFLLS